MRVRDPFEDVDIAARKVVLITFCVIAAAVLYALLYPSQAALVAMILGFFFLILFHEFGHFITAKRTGMKVTEFFVGFGPRVWSTTRGETEYGLKAIPLGGYCRIIGMTNLEEVAEEDEPRAYRNKPWSSKVLVAFAGPAMNFILAGVLMFTVLFFAGDYRAQHPTTTLFATSAGAQQAGLQKGDEVVAINGTAVNSWSQVPALVTKNGTAKPGDQVTFLIRRGENVFPKEVTLQASNDGGPKRAIAGISPTEYLPHPGLLAAVAQTPREVGDITWASVKAIGSVFSPSGISNYFRILAGDSSKNTDQSQRFVSPIGFGRLAQDAVRSGWVTAFGLLLAINVFVGLFNLLPLLPFDGGHIAIATYEKVASSVRRRRVQVDAAKLMPLTVAVLGVLGFLMLSSIYLDISQPLKNPF